jgi:hypothetical protein
LEKLEFPPLPQAGASAAKESASAVADPASNDDVLIIPSVTGAWDLGKR